MVTLCHSKGEYQSMRKVVFVVQRTIHEFQIFSKIDQKLINSFHHNLKGRIVSVLNRPINYIQQICESIDEETMAILFKTIHDLKKFQVFADKYVDEMKTKPLEEKKYTNNMVEIQMKHRLITVFIQTSIFNIHAKQQSNLQAIDQLIILIKQLLQTKLYIQELGLKSQEYKKLEYQSEMKIIKYSKTLASFLMKLPKNDSSSRSNHAIKLSELTRCPYETELLYEQVLKEEADNPEQLLKVLTKYTDFLLKWARIEDFLRVILRKKHIYITIEQFQKIQTVEAKIAQVHQDKQEIQEKRNMLLTKLSNPFSLDQYRQLCSCLKQISCQILKKRTNQQVSQMEALINRLK